MLLAVTTDDLGLMWVAVEGTTLASVFLVNFHRTRASLEAAYKYLLICSVGIALAFVGTVLVYFADVQQFGAEAHALRWTTLAPLGAAAAAARGRAGLRLPARRLRHQGGARAHAHLAARRPQRGARADQRAHVGRAPARVGIYAVLRFKAVVDLAAGPGFARRLLVLLGLASHDGGRGAFSGRPPTSSACSPTRAWSTSGWSRWAWASAGPGASPGAVLHIANHALAKSVLFLLSGRIRDAYGTVEIAPVRGLLAAMPVTGRGFALALLALLGLPPFGLFISELMIFGAGFQRGLARGRGARRWASCSSRSAGCCARCTAWPTARPRARAGARDA